MRVNNQNIKCNKNYKLGKLTIFPALRAEEIANLP